MVVRATPHAVAVHAMLLPELLAALSAVMNVIKLC